MPTFDITFTFADGINSYSTEAELAARYWELAITSGSSALANASGIEISSSVGSLDGAANKIAVANPVNIAQPLSGLGITAHHAVMLVDAADVDILNLDKIIEHEIGHALGIGTLLSTFPNGHLVDGSGDHYIGSAALAEYRILVGAPELASIPMQSDGRDWLEALFASEVMTPTYIQGQGVAALSRITLAALRDLGYDVDLGYSDPLILPSTPILLIDDYAGNFNTQATLAIGSFKGARIELGEDNDWFRVHLSAGSTYTFELNGVATGSNLNGMATGTAALTDPHLMLRAHGGEVLVVSDNDGNGSNARITFTATATGLYYLDASSTNDAGTGSYVVRATLVPPPLFTEAADTVVLPSGGASWHALGGADRVTGTNAADIIFGDSDSDTLFGSGGDDTLYGGTGNDVLVGGIGSDTLVGDAGYNTVDYSASDNRVVVNLSTGYAAGGHAQGDVLVSIQNLIGSTFDDILTGNNGDNTILAGMAGADIIDGRGGDDTADYSASDGRVVVNLAMGYCAGGHAQGDMLLNIESLIGSNQDNDILGGTAAGNVLNGGAGGGDAASYVASDGRVVVNLDTGYAAGGHAQGDKLIAIESLIGSMFANDILSGNAFANSLAGLAGGDTIDGSGGDDTADYSASDGRVVIDLAAGYAAGGHAQGDTLIGIESVIGTAFANDILTGNSLDNTLAGLAGADTLDGQTGYNTADYSASDNRVVINLSTGYAAGGHAQGDTLLSIQNLIGSVFDDILTGTNGDNKTLAGLAGADTIDGRGGDDTADYSASDGRVVIVLASSYAAGGHAQGDILLNIENVVGSNFSGDILGGTAAANALNGGAGGNDTVTYAASDGRVVVNLGTGYAAGGHAQGDTLIGFENIVGSAFANDILTGNSLDNVLTGGLGGDTLDGAGGVDTADYSASDGRVVVNLSTAYAAGGYAQGDILLHIENLIGSSFDNDILTGDSVANVFTGGAGADKFLCEGSFGNDRITDFQNEVDSVRVTGAGEIVAQIDTAQGASYTFANGSTLLLDGTTVAQSIDDIFVTA